MNTDAIRLAQEEISEYRRQLQSKTTELEALKGTQESLERQRQDSEERHHADVLSYQVTRAGNPSGGCWGAPITKPPPATEGVVAVD